jgi:Raf kinase inhibitor-like YbhB/YbcL family protein
VKGFAFAACLAASAAAVRAAAPIGVTSSAIASGGQIAQRFVRAHGNVSPPLAWTPVPGVHVWAVIVDDPDASGPRPFAHWLVWNIPANVTQVAEGRSPAGAIEGRNDFGQLGYGGPQPPSGTHHYHFRLYALDGPLRLAAGADRDALVGAMRGHVVAAGEMVATATAP